MPEFRFSLQIALDRAQEAADAAARDVAFGKSEVASAECDYARCLAQLAEITTQIDSEQQLRRSEVGALERIGCDRWIERLCRSRATAAAAEREAELARRFAKFKLRLREQEYAEALDRKRAVERLREIELAKFREELMRQDDARCDELAELKSARTRGEWQR